MDEPSASSSSSSTAMGFNYTNGFHDAANAIATSVSTRALTPRVALAMAAVVQPARRRSSARKVAKTVGSGIIDAARTARRAWSSCSPALIGAIAWNLLTWYFGLPSSSSHALIGGLVGAAAGRRAAPCCGTGSVDKVVIPMVLSPIVGLVARLPRDGGHPVDLPEGAARARVTRGFRLAQTVSAAAMSLGHGMQDAAKTMGVVVLALDVGGYHADDSASRVGVLPRPPPCSPPAPTPVAGGSCAPWAAGSSTSTRRTGFAAETTGVQRALRRRASATARRSRPPTRSPRRSWASAPPSGSPRCAGAWPATSSAPGSSRSRRRPRSPPSPTSSCRLFGCTRRPPRAFDLGRGTRRHEPDLTPCAVGRRGATRMGVPPAGVSRSGR